MKLATVDLGKEVLDLTLETRKGMGRVVAARHPDGSVEILAGSAPPRILPGHKGLRQACEIIVRKYGHLGANLELHADEFNDPKLRSAIGGWKASVCMSGEQRQKRARHAAQARWKEPDSVETIFPDGRKVVSRCERVGRGRWQVQHECEGEKWDPVILRGRSQAEQSLRIIQDLAKFIKTYDAEHARRSAPGDAVEEGAEPGGKAREKSL